MNELDRLVTCTRKAANGCVEWQGYTGKGGYGLMWHNGGPKKTHRLAYELFVEPPGTLCVLHRCDNPRCVNPAHLFLGTKKQNNEDRDRKGRQNCPRGERHHKAKLNASKVRDVRRRVARGESTRAVGARFGITSATVSNIARRKLWKEVV